MEKTTVSHFSSVVKNLENLHEVLIRNGYYLPKFTSSIINEDYLMQVANGEIWCIKYKEVRLLPCPKPPSKEVLIAKLNDYLNKSNLKAGIDPKH